MGCLGGEAGGLMSGSRAVGRRYVQVAIELFFSERSSMVFAVFSLQVVVVLLIQSSRCRCCSQCIRHSSSRRSSFKAIPLRGQYVPNSDDVEATRSHLQPFYAPPLPIPSASIKTQEKTPPQAQCPSTPQHSPQPPHLHH